MFVAIDINDNRSSNKTCIGALKYLNALQMIIQEVASHAQIL
jgi:hypothetical protein